MARSCGKFSLEHSSVSLGLAFTLGLANLSPANAADFSKAKQIYVPPSRIVRRVDFASMREEVTSMPQKVNYAVKPAAKPQTATVRKTAPVTAKAPAQSSTKALGNSLLQSVKSKMNPALTSKMEATARSLIQSGRLDEAQRVLNKLAQMSPEDQALMKDVAHLSVQRAQELMKKGNVHDALIATREALSANPQSTEAANMLNQLHKKTGIDPSNINDRLNNAHGLYAKGQLHEAEVEYQASLAVKPTSDAHVGLAKIAAHHNSTAKAKQHLDKALELDANSASARRELGLLHYQQGDLVSANSELSRALVLNPADNTAGSALVKLWQGQVSKVPNANSHLGLARAYQLTGDLPAAQAEYRQVVRMDPNHPYLPAARQSFKLQLARQEAEKSLKAAKTLESQGLPQEAYKKLQQAISLSPGDASYKMYQGELLEKMGLQSNAREAYLSVLKDDPQNVLAAQRIKALPSQTIPNEPLTRHPEGFPGTKFPFPATGSPLTALTSAAAPLTRHPDGFPGTKFPLLADPAAVAAGTAVAQGVPVGVGGVPVDHVGTLSNFLGSLRGHMTDQKAVTEKFEDQIRNVMKPQKATEVTEALHSAGGDDLVERILRSPVGSPLPTSGAGAAAAAAEPALRPAITGASASGLMKSLPSPAAAPHTAPPAAPPSAIQSLAPQIAPQAAAAAQQPAPAPVFAPGAATLPQSAFNAAPITGAAPYSPPTAAELAQAGFQPAPAGVKQPVFNAPQAAPTTPYLSPGAAELAQAGFKPVPAAAGITQPVFAAPQAGAAAPQAAFTPAPAAAASDFPAAQSMLPYIPQSAQSAVSNVVPSAVTQQQTSQPALAPEIPQSAASQTAPSLTAAPLRFELMEIQPGLSDVRLRVVLKNDSGRNVSIHDRMQAIIKYRDARESQVKIAFLGKTVPPGGALEGIVKVPLSKVDPSADLILRHVAPSSHGDPELHLITSISQR